MKKNLVNEMKLQPTGRVIVLNLFELHELSEEAQENAYREWLDEYRYSTEHICDLQYSDVIHYGDKALASVGIDAEWDSWDNCFPGNYIDPYTGRGVAYMTAADYLPDAENICHMEDYGYYSSMDMADAFNVYESELRGLVDEYRKTDDYDKRGDIADRFAYLHREACRDACKVFRDRYEEEKEDLESFERFEDETTQGYRCYTRDSAGRVYCTDCRKWYTEDGELYEQSDVNHACISIVKAG